MPNQPRVAKVLVALLVAMTTGAIVLMALGHNPPAAGPYSLTSHSIDPLQDAVRPCLGQSPNRWSRIEISYSGTRAGNIELLASLNGRRSPDGLNCHFVICNGFGGNDGEIQPTGKWQKQFSAIPGQTRQGTGQTIRFCIIPDGKTKQRTNHQKKMVDALIEKLCERFNIESLYYPGDW